MKIISNRFFNTLICLLGVSIAFAGGGGPPAPTQRRPPPPPGAPIDENLFIFFLFAILFGAYIIYNQSIKTKATT